MHSSITYLHYITYTTAKANTPMQKCRNIRLEINKPPARALTLSVMSNIKQKGGADDQVLVWKIIYYTLNR